MTLQKLGIVSFLTTCQCFEAHLNGILMLIQAIHWCICNRHYQGLRQIMLYSAQKLRGNESRSLHIYYPATTCSNIDSNLANRLISIQIRHGISLDLIEDFVECFT